MTGWLAINEDFAIHEDELTMRFVRASGPGGQNVNKVSTAVELRFDLAASPSRMMTSQKMSGVPGHSYPPTRGRCQLRAGISTFISS